MKKFYSLIFTGAFLFTTFLSQAQVFNSITSNPNHWTLDDPRFWGATLPADIINPAFSPPANCTGCTIKIFSNVTVVPFNGGTAANGGVATTSLVPGANDPSLNHITLTNSTVNVFGNTTLSLNTWMTLVNSSITIGNNPTDAETIFVNDQVDLHGSSAIRLANFLTVVNANNDIGKTNILGTFLFGGFLRNAGIYTIRQGAPTDTGPVGNPDYTLNTVENINNAGTFGVTPYTINCNPVSTCANGLVFGPTITQYDATNDFYSFQQSTTLPVVLVQFIATQNSNGSVKVSWATSQEQNSAYYDVERSGDQTAWTKIGSVQAKGYASTTTNYSLNDNLPIKGTGYYRLKMVDQDGKFTYSKTVAVTSNNSDVPLVIYSNPFNDQIRLKVNVSMGQNLTLTVSDMLGKTYISQNFQAQAGDNYINLQPTTTGNGMYVLHIHGNTYDQTVKLEKQ